MRELNYFLSLFLRLFTKLVFFLAKKGGEAAGTAIYNARERKAADKLAQQKSQSREPIGTVKKQPAPPNDIKNYDVVKHPNDVYHSLVSGILLNGNKATPKDITILKQLNSLRITDEHREAYYDRAIKDIEDLLCDTNNVFTIMNETETIGFTRSVGDLNHQEFSALKTGLNFYKDNYMSAAAIDVMLAPIFFNEHDCKIESNGADIKQYIIDMRLLDHPCSFKASSDDACGIIFDKIRFAVRKEDLDRYLNYYKNKAYTSSSFR